MLGMTERGDRASRMVTRRFTSSLEADRHDLEFWMQIPENERLLQAWAAQSGALAVTRRVAR